VRLTILDEERVCLINQLTNLTENYSFVMKNKNIKNKINLHEVFSSMLNMMEAFMRKVNSFT